MSANPKLITYSSSHLIWQLPQYDGNILLGLSKDKPDRNISSYKIEAAAHQLLLLSSSGKNSAKRIFIFKQSYKKDVGY